MGGRGKWCMRTSQKGGMVQKEGIIKGRDDAGGHDKGVKGRKVLKEGIVTGRDDA